MGQTGFLLRFVDIVLILLFGFICISSIKPSQVQPPKSSESPYKDIEQKRVVYVSIKREGTFLVGRENRVVGYPSEFKSFLLQKKREIGGNLKVRIRSSRSAPIVFLMRAAKMCEELGIRKSIEVEIDKSR